MAKSMNEEHLKTRKQLVFVAVVVILLFISGETSYKVPQVDVTIKGIFLWPLLAFLQIFLIAQGHLTGAINGVQMPWSVPRKGPWGDKSVWRLPEYWVVFFNQGIPISSYSISIICIAIQHYKLFISS